MVLVLLALLLVEAGTIPFLGLFSIRTEMYMRVPGYSWKTNEYGLTVDTVTEFHLVLPNGTQMVVTETDKDLWFALKVCLCLYTATEGSTMSSLLTRATGRI